jgi:hypothetical protein
MHACNPALLTNKKKEKKGKKIKHEIHASMIPWTMTRKRAGGNSFSYFLFCHESHEPSDVAVDDGLCRRSMWRNTTYVFGVLHDTSKRWTNVMVH